MKINRWRTLLVVALFLLGACEQADQATGQQIKIKPTSQRKATHFVIGTGSVQGVYYPIAGVICRLVNRAKQTHHVRCSVESTSGSIYNLKELRAGDIDLAVAQSDWQYHAYNGNSVFAEAGANEALRSVFALEADPLAVLVKADSRIQRFEDLQGAIIGPGYSRSLQSRIFYDLLDAMQWEDKVFKAVRRIKDTKQISALCAGEMDAVMLLSSSLTEHLARAENRCELRLIAIDGEAVTQVIREKPYYRIGRIAKNRYYENQPEVVSFGLGASFVALESASPKAIYHVVKEIVENFNDFKSLHPSLSTLKKSELAYAGLTAPLHPGAVRYFKEARLLKH